MEFASVAGIVVICLLIGKAFKESPVDSRFIPVICGIIGGALGILGMFSMPSFPADNIIDACAVGIVSGFASTGAHQSVKQLMDGD